MRGRTVEVGNIAVKQIADTKYAQHLFVEPGIAGKLCVILRRPSDAICLSLYRDRKHSSFGSEDMGRIHRIKLDLAAAMERHLSLTAKRRAAGMRRSCPRLLARIPGAVTVGARGRGLHPAADGLLERGHCADLIYRSIRSGPIVAEPISSSA